MATASASSHVPPAPIPTEDTSLEFAIIGTITICVLLIVCCSLAAACRKIIWYTSPQQRMLRVAEAERENTEKRLENILSPPELTYGGGEDDDDPTDNKKGGEGGDDMSLRSGDMSLRSGEGMMGKTPEEVAQQAIQDYHARLKASKKRERKMAKAKKKLGKRAELQEMEDDTSSAESSELSTSSDEEGNPKPSTLRKRAKREFEMRMIMEEAQAKYNRATGRGGGGEASSSEEEIPLELAMVPRRDHPENFLHPLPTEYSRGAGDDAPKAYAALITKDGTEKHEATKYKDGNFTAKHRSLRPDVLKGQPGRAAAPDPKNPLLRPPRRPIAKDQTPWSHEATTLMQNRLKALRKERRKKPKARVHIEDATFIDSDEDDDSSRGGGGHGSDLYDDEDDSTMAGSDVADLLRATSAYRGARGAGRRGDSSGGHGTNSSTSGSYMTGSTSFMSGGSMLGGLSSGPPPSANSWQPVVTPTQRLAAAKARTLGQEEEAKPKAVTSQQAKFPKEDSHVFDFKAPTSYDDL